MKYAFVAFALSMTALAGKTVRGRIAQPANERVWFAGRYDSTHIIVYFDAVAVRNSLPRDSNSIPEPRAFGFFGPVGISPSDLARIFQRNSRARERFTIGDQYDLLTGGDHAVAVTLTRLVACLGDEGVGNDSYIGAIAQVSAADLALIAQHDYYVVVPHQALHRIPRTGIIDTSATSGMRRALNRLLRPLAGKAAPNGRFSLLETQRVRLADGGIRWFVRAIDRDTTRACTTIAAWVSGQGSPQIASADTVSCMFDGPPTPPRLLNVAGLGAGRTALVVRFEGEDSMVTSVLEYSAGKAIRQMRVLWTVSAGE